MTKYLQIMINGQVDAIITKDAYREYTLRMSTGDYHVHTVVELDKLPDEIDECESVLDMYEVRDWADNLIREADLGTFQDTWDWIYENILNPDESDSVYEDLYVQPRKPRLRLVA